MTDGSQSINEFTEIVCSRDIRSMSGEYRLQSFLSTLLRMKSNRVEWTILHESQRMLSRPKIVVRLAKPLGNDDQTFIPTVQRFVVRRTHMRSYNTRPSRSAG